MAARTAPPRITYPVEVRAPSRLHLGLLSFGQRGRRQFGGAGMMIDQPGVVLRVELADAFVADGRLADRTRQFVERWSRYYGRTRLPACRIRVLETPPQHVGLGVGTQLGMAVAAALHRAGGGPLPAAEELAASVGRAQRSAVGTYGFLQGGFLVERGRRPGDRISPLDCRLPLPAKWRVVLIRPGGGARGLAGTDERDAFRCLPPVPLKVTEQLWRELHERMLPALEAAEFSAFSESVYRYGYAAGSCFADAQGGPYRGDQLVRLVQWLRAEGVRGIGQSSWGPTVFALLPDESSARQLILQLERRRGMPPLHAQVAAPNNKGAQWTRMDANRKIEPRGCATHLPAPENLGE